MILDEEKKQKVIGWIKEGRKVSEIQNLLASEFGIRMTYMEVRLLINELNVMPVDLEPKEEKKTEQGKDKQTGQGTKPRENKETEEVEISDVSVSIDEVTRPGAVMSGRVRFSDGVSAEWYVDQMGRLGIATDQPNYRPSEKDIRKFQVELQRQLSQMGLF